MTPMRTRQILIFSMIGAVAIVVMAASIVRMHGASYPELSIAEGAPDFKSLSDRFQKLAKEKGALYAYEILRRAPLPPQTDIHLLGHIVGDELYRQKGVQGIANCTQEFRNACSHSIVIGALNDFGEGALPKIHDACKAAPGGSGAYTMCYHGLGHGVFAYFKYSLPETVAFCKKTGTPEYHDREYVECVGGAIMELMGGGAHDHENWLKSRNKYLSATDPLSPCSSSVLPKEVKGICYTYITPHLFEFAGADLAMPQPEHFAKAFQYCDHISKSTTELRIACFAGIGKELPLLAVARDARTIATATNEQLAQMRDWCKTAPHKEAHDDCVHSIADSLFWGGENGPDVSIRFCSIADSEERSNCFAYLFNIASFYVPRDAKVRSDFCSLMPRDVLESCREKM